MFNLFLIFGTTILLQGALIALNIKAQLAFRVRFLFTASVMALIAAAYVNILIVFPFLHAISAKIRFERLFPELISPGIIGFIAGGVAGGFLSIGSHYIRGKNKHNKIIHGVLLLVLSSTIVLLIAFISYALALISTLE